MTDLNAQYWEQRYRQDNTPWNIGSPSPPLQHYANGLSDRSVPILFPGAGHAHDAIALHRNGFSNVLVCDWAPSAFEYLRTEAPDFPQQQLIVSDFFKLDIKVDLILEQTFFCALDPSLRSDYVEKASALLTDKGKIAGLLFAEQFSHEGPPYGGDQEEYEQLFSPHFHILQMGIAEDSIKPRAGRELFVELEKKG